MPKKAVIFALVIVALHLCEVGALGSSRVGSLVANVLQLAGCAFAVAMAYGAYKRGRGVSRPFWLLVGAGIAMWGVANLGWMYYEVVLLTQPPAASLVRFLFGLENVMIATALFLDQDKDSAQLEAESALDFFQIGIVFFFIYLEYYVLPAHRLDSSSAFLREMRIENVEDVSLAMLAGFQTLRARKQGTRKLYGGLALYLLLLSVLSALAQYLQSVRPAPTGTWRDLLWTVPFLVFAMWAAQWQPGPAVETGARLRRKRFSELMLANATFALAPLLILWQVSRLQAEWHQLRFSLLGVSIVCYAARLGLSEYRQSRAAELARRNTLAMDSAINGMAILDASGKCIYANAAYAKMLNDSAPIQVIGKNWQELAAAGDTSGLQTEISRGLEQNGKWNGPVTVHRPDGRAVPLDMAISSLPDGGTICVAIDISQQLIAQRAHAEAEIRYRTLIEQVSAISYIAELGVNGKWIYVSPQVEGILGYKPEEWLASSENWLQFVLVEDHPILIAAEEKSAREEPFQAEYRIRRKDGKAIWVSDTGVVVRGEGNQLLMEGVILDINERKQLENQLQQSRRMEAVGRLAGGIAHDFNNLLTVIRGYADMALNRPGTQAGVRADIQQIGGAADRATALIRQLLAYSRKQVLQPKVLNLNAVVENLHQLLSRLMGDNIEMKTFCNAANGTVKADPAQIEQVIVNMVVNARDAMAEGGKLTIETANVVLDAAYAVDQMTIKPGSYVMLSISDTGIGMDKQTQAHVFDPFFTTKEAGRGTGLGLSTVYGIVKQSDGYVWVESEHGKGSTFRVYLPLAKELLTQEESPVEERKDVSGTEVVLLVEDEEAVLELAHTILEQQGYRVLVARNTAHAEELAAESKGEIHMLLTDVVMPGVSGHELAKRITARRPGIRVLFMSGYAEDIVSQGGVLKSGVAFLQKPFTPKVLRQRVREILDQLVVVRQ